MGVPRSALSPCLAALSVCWLAVVAACGSSADTVMVLTQDGGVYIGTVQDADTSTLAIRDAAGELHVIDRQTIVSMGRPSETGTEANRDRSPVEPGPEPDAQAQTDPEPAVEPVPEFKTVVIPVEQVMLARLDQAIDTTSARPNDSVYGHLLEPLVVDGEEVVPAGAGLTGAVSIVRRPAEDATPSRLVFAFTELHRSSSAAPVTIVTTDIDRSGRVREAEGNRVTGFLGRIVGRGRRDVAEELTLGTDTTYEVVLREPLSFDVLVDPTPASPAIRR